jgi:hypothetical protein
MKKYNCQLVVNLECQAENMEEAQNFFQEMEVTFRDPYTLNLMDSDWVTWEVTEE